jgi:hypothetical protein
MQINKEKLFSVIQQHNSWDFTKKASGDVRMPMLKAEKMPTKKFSNGSSLLIKPPISSTSL